jgi:hypothetical protein
MYANTWFEIDFTKCLIYVAKRQGASFSLSKSGAIFGPPGCGTNILQWAARLPQALSAGLEASRNIT